MGRRIAILLPSMSGGGIEKVMLNVAVGLVQRNHEVTIVLVQAKGPLLAKIPHSIRTVDLRGRRSILALPALIFYLRREKPDVVVSALECVNLLNLWGRMLSKVNFQCILTTHTTVSKDFLKLPAYKKWLGIFLMQRFYGKADRVLAVSEGVAKDVAALTKLPETSFCVVYNPVVTPEIFDAALQSPEHPWFKTDPVIPIVLGIGRLSVEKDFVTLIRAFERVSREIECRLMILGDGPDRKELEQLIDDLGQREHIVLAGYLNNPYAYIAHASLFVLSSRYEGLPTVLIEALALGTPVVATNCQHGPDEILRGGMFGKLVPVGDVERMATAILGALNSYKEVIPEEAWRPYEFNRVVDRYEELLN